MKIIYIVAHKQPETLVALLRLAGRGIALPTYDRQRKPTDHEIREIISEEIKRDTYERSSHRAIRRRERKVLK